MKLRTKFFFNMPPLNERDPGYYDYGYFLARLGFAKQQTGEAEKRKKILGLF